MKVLRNQLVLPLNFEVLIDENDPVWKLTEICDALDYSRLYDEYLRHWRSIDPAIMFEILVFANMNCIYKSMLNEYAYKNNVDISYTLLSERGPDHEKEFEVALIVKDEKIISWGKSKKIAEKEAARLFCQKHNLTFEKKKTSQFSKTYILPLNSSRQKALNAYLKKLNISDYINSNELDILLTNNYYANMIVYSKIKVHKRAPKSA